MRLVVAVVISLLLWSSAFSDDGSGRLWIVSGADAVAERLERTGANVVRVAHAFDPGGSASLDEWRETGYLRVHRLVVAARRAFAAEHGAAPQYTYFVGVGRESGNAALHEAQQFPEDVDGVVAIAPEIAPAAGRPEGEFLNAANPDLHAFRRRGGKLILRAPRTGALAGRLSGYRDRVFEIEGSALRAGRFFAFAFSDGPDDTEALSAMETLVSWRERGVLPRENAAYDDTPAAATATADRYSWRTHTVAEAHGDASVPEDPFDYIRGELAKGRKSIRVPTARYEVMPKVKLDGGSFAYLILAGLNDVTIDFGGSELVGRLRTRVMDCRDCSNLTIKNLTVDFADLPFTQGEIVKVDGEGTWDVRILDGYPAPEPTGEKGESASHDDFWPMQAYDARTTDWVNPMRFQDGIKLEKTGDRTYRVSGGGNRAGKVGDIAVWSIKDRSHAVVGETFVFQDCPQLTCVDVTLFSTPHGRAFYEFNPNASVFSGCRIIRRPPETDLCRRAMRRLRSGNHDGIISKAGVKGPRIEDCQFTYHCDDCVNISGQYSVFSRKEGRKWRILDNWVGIRLRVGSKLQILTFDGRTLTNEVTVLANVDAGPATDEERKFMTYEAGLVFGHGKSIRHASELTVDSDVDPGRYAAIVSDACLGNGFCITNCVFGYSRSRGLLIKASHGQVRDNLIVRTCGSALAVTTEYSWLSGGCASDLDIAGNTLWHAGRWLVSIGGDVGVGRKVKAELQPGAHHDIRLWGNRLVGSRGIQLEGCDSCLVRDNDFSVEDTKPGLRLWLRRSGDIDADVPCLKEPLAGSCANADGFVLEPCAGDVLILPFGEGMAYPVETDIPIEAPHLHFRNGMELSMGFFGRCRGGTYEMFGVADTLRAGLAFSRTNGLLRVAYEGPKDNELRVFRAKTLGEAAAAYRSWREERGGVRTMADKVKANPNLLNFAGTADIWLWDDNTQSRLYNWPLKTDVPPRDTRRIADEMKSLGLDRVLWNSFEGETPEDCAYLKSIGYHVGTYECLRDVFHKGLLGVASTNDYFRAARFLPIADEIVRVNADGSFATAWTIPDKSGKMHPMHALCDAIGLEMCKRFIAPEVKRIGYDSRLMDVQACGGPAVCHSKKHPCTDREALEALRREHRYVCDDLRQITGVEVGSELLADAFHYSEGLTSCPHPFRKDLCWRYKDRALYGADVPETTRNILHNPRCRIPLWELVYHDCTVSYYYWADSTLMYPELTKTKDLFCALYGLPPIYSMNVSTWNRLKREVVASYARATPVARRTMYSRMTEFEILTPDRLVQRTRFANGVSVTANFSDKDWSLEDGTIVPPQGYRLSEGGSL